MHQNLEGGQCIKSNILSIVSNSFTQYQVERMKTEVVCAHIKDEYCVDNTEESTFFKLNNFTDSFVVTLN